MFPAKIKTSSSHKILTSHQSLKSSTSAVRRAARASDNAWQNRHLDLHATNPSHNQLPNNTTIQNNQQELDDDNMFQKYQQNIHRERQRGHRRQRKRRRRKKESLDDKRICTAIQKATRRCRALPSHSSRTHLLDLCANALNYISTSTTASSPQSMPLGQISSLCETMKNAVLTLSKHDSPDQISANIAVNSNSQINTLNNKDSGRKNRSRSQSNTSTDSYDLYENETEEESMYIAHKKRWEKSDKKRSQRKNEPSVVLKQVHSSLNDVIRAPVAINDWAEELLSEDMMNEATQQLSMSVEETSIVNF